MAVNSVEHKEDLKVFENIVDKDGHKRFIEGEVTTPAQTGVTWNYARWSLSGSHLMIVIAGSVTAGNEASFSLSSVAEIPDWIKSKLHTLGTGDNITYSTIDTYTEDTGNIGHQNVILINHANVIQFYHGEPIGNEDHDVSFRCQFDLLIDNE